VTGIFGAITPLKSPPPSTKALFDFSVAGPLAGFAVSLALLFSGLELTQATSLNSQPLPVLPVDLVRASSLGGNMVQYFLGKLAILPDQGPNAFVELHPFAIAGFIGCLINALAMLPIGRKFFSKRSVDCLIRRNHSRVCHHFRNLQTPTVAGFHSPCLEEGGHLSTKCSLFSLWCWLVCLD
jgi:hypothetical protein